MKKQKAKNYISNHNLEVLLTDMVNSVTHERPNNPIVHMIKYLSGTLSNEDRENCGINVNGPYPKKKPKKNISIERDIVERNRVETINYYNEQQQINKDLCQQSYNALSKEFNPDKCVFIILLPQFDINPHEMICEINSNRPLPYHAQKMNLNDETKCYTCALEELESNIQLSFNFKCTWYLDPNDEEKVLVKYIVSNSGIRAKMIRINAKILKNSNIIYFPENKGFKGKEYQLQIRLAEKYQIEFLDIKNMKIPDSYSAWNNANGFQSDKITDNSYNVIRPYINCIYVDNILVKETHPPKAIIRKLEIYSYKLNDEANKAWSYELDLTKNNILIGEIFYSKPIEIKKYLNDVWKKNEELHHPVCSLKQGSFIIEPKSVSERLIYVSLSPDHTIEVQADNKTIFYLEAEIQIIGTIELQIGLELGKKNDPNSFYNYCEGIVITPHSLNKVRKSEFEYVKYLINSEKEPLSEIRDI